MLELSRTVSIAISLSISLASLTDLNHAYQRFELPSAEASTIASTFAVILITFDYLLSLPYE